jgi:hypothetical protein
MRTFRRRVLLILASRIGVSEGRRYYNRDRNRNEAQTSERSKRFDARGQSPVAEAVALVEGEFPGARLVKFTGAKR